MCIWKHDKFIPHPFGSAPIPVLGVRCKDEAPLLPCTNAEGSELKAHWSPNNTVRTILCGVRKGFVEHVVERTGTYRAAVMGNSAVCQKCQLSAMQAHEGFVLPFPLVSCSWLKLVISTYPWVWAEMTCDFQARMLEPPKLCHASRHSDPYYLKWWLFHQPTSLHDYNTQKSMPPHDGLVEWVTSKPCYFKTVWFGGCLLL